MNHTSSCLFVQEVVKPVQPYVSMWMITTALPSQDLMLRLTVCFAAAQLLRCQLGCKASLWQVPERDHHLRHPEPYRPLSQDPQLPACCATEPADDPHQVAALPMHNTQQPAGSVLNQRPSDATTLLCTCLDTQKLFKNCHGAQLHVAMPD